MPEALDVAEMDGADEQPSVVQTSDSVCDELRAGTFTYTVLVPPVIFRYLPA